MGFCDNCGNKKHRISPHAARTKEYYELLIGPLRHVAERCGYALAVHGSLAYDIDLVAIPWRPVSPIDPASLAEHIRQTAEVIIGMAFVSEGDKNQPTKKPWGRLAWSFYLAPEPGPYIDLSVIPHFEKEDR